MANKRYPTTIAPITWSVSPENLKIKPRIMKSEERETDGRREKGDEREDILPGEDIWKREGGGKRTLNQQGELISIGVEGGIHNSHLIRNGDGVAGEKKSKNKIFSSGERILPKKKKKGKKEEKQTQ